MTITLKPLIKIAIVGAVAWYLTACASVLEGVTPVQNFDAQRYLGKWYEIARLDNRFERGLENITAEYSLRPDGHIKVVNRGLSIQTQQWKQSEGVAKFVGSRTVGQLKVSFFGPFYGGYNVVELDPDYQYALVVGNDRSYLWILSRTSELAPHVKTKLVAKARALGFATDKLIWVKH